VLDTGPSANELRFFRQSDRAKAEEIARAVEQSGEEKTRVAYLAGFETSTKIRDDHFELWLAPGNVLSTLVQQLNDPAENVRKTAGGRLARDHRANPEAIDLVLSTLSPEKLRSLSSDGRINALYFLSRSELGTWTDKQRKLALEAIERIRKGYGDVAVGEQTGQALNSLEQKLLPKAYGR
jgi:type II secretory pathway pseudopilin PulG